MTIKQIRRINSLSFMIDSELTTTTLSFRILFIRMRINILERYDGTYLCTFKIIKSHFVNFFT